MGNDVIAVGKLQFEDARLNHKRTPCWTPNATSSLCTTAPSHSVVLDGVLREQRLRLPLHACLQRRPDQVVEQERSVHQERKAQHLKPLERLPTKAQREDPDEERAAGVDGGARCGGDGASHRQTEEVEATGLR